MVSRFYGYQYDTNPRKLNQQENAPYRNRYSQKNNNNSNLDDYIGSKKYSENKTAKKESVQTTRKVNIDKSERHNRTTKTVASHSKKNKFKIKIKSNLVICLIAGFLALFAISYQNSLISESFNKKEQYKKEMEALSKTNQQLEVSIENSLNMNNIEQAAKDKLGMQKLANNQKIYVNLPKQDYVAPAAEQIVIEEETSFLDKLVKGLSGIF